jgi:lactate dehydrogenase-like 2-hydroxyacid dehydrogenase
VQHLDFRIKQYWFATVQIANPHVMLVPHMGTWTVETQTKMETWCIDNVRSAIEKGKLMSPVGEQKDIWGKGLKRVDF